MPEGIGYGPGVPIPANHHSSPNAAQNSATARQENLQTPSSGNHHHENGPAQSDQRAEGLGRKIDLRG